MDSGGIGLRNADRLGPGSRRGSSKPSLPREQNRRMIFAVDVVDHRHGQVKAFLSFHSKEVVADYLWTAPSRGIKKYRLRHLAKAKESNCMMYIPESFVSAFLLLLSSSRENNGEDSHIGRKNKPRFCGTEPLAFPYDNQLEDGFATQDLEYILIGQVSDDAFKTNGSDLTMMMR
jgi:hypothetical protein